MSKSILGERSFDFALKIYQLCKNLRIERHEYEMSKQLLRSSTSIGAIIEEALGAFSRPDFIYRFTVAYKEARETRYWLRLLKAANEINELEADKLLKEADQIISMLVKALLTLKNQKR
jgi:four helix bundle protein